MPTAPKCLRYRKTKLVENRLPPAQRGYDWQWQKHRKARVQMLLLRDGALCGICKRPLPAQSKQIHIDHKVAPSTKGPVGSEAYNQWFNDQDNWQLACARCNSAKQNRPA